MELPNPLQLTMRNADLRAMVSQLKYQRMLRHDMVVPASAIQMENDHRIVILDAPPPPIPQEAGDELSTTLAELGIPVEGEFPRDQRFKMLSIAEGQFSSRLSIPKKYWDLIRRTNPALLAHNVNERLTGLGGLSETKDGNFLVRTFRPDDGVGDGTIRALLSDRFKILDNLDLLFTALQTLGPKGIDAPIDGNDIICNLTERKMYLQIKCPSISIRADELLKGYINPGTGEGGARMHAGMVLSNSETGGGAFQVMPRPYANICMNCFTYRRDALRRVHLGAQMDQGGIIWSDETRTKNLELIQSQVKDAVTTFLSKEYLLSLSKKFEANAQRTLQHPRQAIENYATFLGISEEEQEDVLAYFYKSGQDTKAIGLVNTVTYFAQTVSSADRQFEIEEAALEALDHINRFDVPAKEIVEVQ